MNEYKEDCPFCELGQNPVGYINDRGAGIVYKTDKGPLNDPSHHWFVTLMPTTASDPKTGFNFQIMPQTHYESLSDINIFNAAAQLGDALVSSNSVMEKILASENPYHTKAYRIGAKFNEKGKFPHLHFKLTPFSGPASYDTPFDVGYQKKPVLIDENGERYIKSPPGKKIKLDEKRWQNLFDKAIELFRIEKIYRK